MQMIRPAIKEALMVTPVTVYPQSATDSMGDTTPLPAVLYHGYVYVGQEVVLNMEGKEELSSMQIYLQGSDADLIDVHSLVSCLENVQQRIIAKKVYRGRQGAKVIGVLYLP